MPRTIVVFAETDDDGQVFASVRDDGTGFDPAAATRGHGLSESIAGRHGVDRRAVPRCAARAGGGTEVRLWTRRDDCR